MTREVTCDESGYEGEKLIDSTKPLFAHASVGLGADEAAELVLELRSRIRSPATQYRSNHLLREKHRSTLEWFLSPDSPVHGHGNVYLIDKAWWVATRLADLLGLDPAGLDTSPYFLAAANDLMRAKDTPGVVDEFFRVSGFAEGRERAELFRTWLRSDPVVNSVLDPLVPALVAVVDHWGPVSVLHDRQTTLPARRVERIRELTGGRLGGIRFLSADHPQIQVADILAGTVRHLAEQGESELIQPYLDPNSFIRPPVAGLLTPPPPPAAGVGSAGADGAAPPGHR